MSRSTCELPQGTRPPIIGFDCEYQSEGGHNLLLSYQAYGIAPEGQTWGCVWPSADGKRPELIQVVAAAIRHGIKKSALKGWPKQIVLVSHFTRAEFAHLADFDDKKKKFPLVRGSWITSGKPRPIGFWDSSRNHHEIRITLIDTMLHAPDDSKGLDHLGELIGIPKVSLTDWARNHAPSGTPEIQLEQWAKENMALLLETDRELFERYALTDSEIAARYFSRVLDFTEQNGLPIWPMPPTAGSIAVRLCEKAATDASIDLKAALGIETEKRKAFSETRGRKVTVNRERPIPIAAVLEGFAKEAFHGGRNECFAFGPFTRSFTDYDLAGAYTTAMAGFREPDYEAAYLSQDPDEFREDMLGFAYVEASFPPWTRFPVFPVPDKDGRGLLFPLNVETFATAPEIALARRLGARVTIRKGLIIPWKSDLRPFLPFSRLVNQRRMRAKHKGDTFSDQLWKLIGNSVYGKTAQGVRDDTVFDSLTDQYRQMPPSRITCSFAAAFVTGTVRAVLGEILNSLPQDRRVLAAITDGFITDATQDEVDAATRGPLCQWFAELRERITESRGILEAKGRADGMVVCRTRVHFSIGVMEHKGELKPILAKTGMKPPGATPFEQNEEMLRLFANRQPGEKVQIGSLTSALKLYREGGDLIQEIREVALNMDFDWKRRPHDPQMNFVLGRRHVAWDTRPWENMEEFEKNRNLWDREREAWKLCRGNFGPLKSVETLRSFETYVSTADARAQIGLKRKDHIESPYELAARAVRTALAQGACGLPEHKPKPLVAAMNQLGCECSVDQAKKARRHETAYEIIPYEDPEVRDLMHNVKDRYPGFDGTLLLPSGQKAFLASREDQNVVHLPARRASYVSLDQEPQYLATG